MNNDNREGQTINPKEEGEKTVTKRVAAAEVFRSQKTLKTCTIFNLAAVFICAAAFSTSAYIGGILILAAVGYNAWLMYKAQQQLIYLSQKYGFDYGKQRRQ